MTETPTRYIDEDATLRGTTQERLVLRPGVTVQLVGTLQGSVEVPEGSTFRVARSGSVQGNLAVDGETRIHGQVLGNLAVGSTGRVYIEVDGVVAGNFANNGAIWNHGTVAGNFTGDDLLTTPTSRVIHPTIGSDGKLSFNLPPRA
jgi:hypothetical protein